MFQRVYFIYFLLISTSSLAQSDFRKGFIVTNELDTLTGFVDYRPGNNAFKTCGFKGSEIQTEVIYKPFEILGYGFTNDRAFEAKVVTNPDQSIDSLFLELIVAGKISLYKFQQKFFVQKEGDKLYQLMNSTKSGMDGDYPVIRNLNEHVGILTMLMFDCEKLRSRIPDIRLVEKELLKLVVDYNTCKGEKVVIFKENIPWFKAVGGLAGGVGLSQINFVSDLSEYVHLNGSFDPSWVPVVGLSVDFLAPRLNEGLSFHVEFFYMSANYRLMETENYFGLITWDDITINLQELNIPIGVRYVLQRNNIAPYFNVGFSSILNLKTSSVWKDERNPNGHQEDPLPIKNNQFGLWGGVGIYKSLSKKFSASLEVRYEVTNSIAKTSTQPPEINSKIHNFYFTVGIRTK